ncbi:uncharacterized protein LOC134470325 [Cavia porcellus]|uniref:uncharacterized protein LOC134470325 n=1 Tax=Cavia porcellus TaxID=10141 RepID=UPI002FE10B34
MQIHKCCEQNRGVMAGLPTAPGWAKIPGLHARPGHSNPDGEEGERKLGALQDPGWVAPSAGPAAAPAREPAGRTHCAANVGATRPHRRSPPAHARLPGPGPRPHPPPHSSLGRGKRSAAVSRWHLYQQNGDSTHKTSNSCEGEAGGWARQSGMWRKVRSHKGPDLMNQIGGMSATSTQRWSEHTVYLWEEGLPFSFAVHACCLYPPQTAASQPCHFALEPTEDGLKPPISVPDLSRA